jgi:ABC-type nitrate/sulfonate/bicarbonate transport system ATPase subunit
MTAASARDAARHWIKRLGLAGRESAKLEALSHGNQQRAAATIYGRSILRTGSRVRLRQVLARGEAA